MIGAALRSLMTRRRRGAVAIVAVAAMVPVTAMIAANANSGQMVNERRMTQDGADALAVMHGTWTARSLNVISMNTVTATQLLTVAIGSEALAGTLQEIRITAGLVDAYITGHGALHCPPRTPDPVAAAVIAVAWTAPCLINHGVVAIPANLALAKTFITEARYDPNHGIDVSHKALRAIEGMNRAIVERFPRAMREIGEDYAEELGIDAFHFADPCNGYGVKNCTRTNTDDGMALPLDEGGFEARSQFCAAMQFGTTARFTTFRQRGFPIGKGPMTHGGARSNPVVKDHINDLTGIGSDLRRFKDYYDSPATLLGEYIHLWVPYRKGIAPNLFGPQQATRNNAFTRRYDTKFASLCLVGKAISGPLNQLVRMEIEAPVPTFWQLKDIAPLNPMPIVQPDRMPDAFRVLAVTQKDKGRRLAAQVLTEKVESHFGYGQTGVYNPDGADLFSQKWRYRMMPATRMDDPAKMARDLKRQAKAPFRPLATALGAVASTGTWGRVNAH